MQKKTLPAPLKLRNGRDRGERGWSAAFELLGTVSIHNLLGGYPPPNSLVFIGEFNLHSNAGSACMDAIERFNRVLEDSKGDIRVEVAPKFNGIKQVDWTLDEYLLTTLVASIRAVNGISTNPSFIAECARFSREKFETVKAEIQHALDSMYPANNLMKMIADSGYADFVARVEGKPVFIIWKTLIFALFNNDALSAISPVVTFDYCFKKMLDIFLVPSSTQKRLHFEESEITIGMDPELEGYFIGADGPDFDSQCIANRYIDRPNGRVGCDGHSDIFELRPKFSTNPKAVVENTKKCFETLAFALASTGRPVYLFGGGGILDSIGGHIHIGGPFFKSISTDEIGAFLGPILDDFVYWPIRDRMPGALRAWGNHPALSKRRNAGRCGFPDKRPVVVFDEITKAPSSRNLSLAGYEGPSAFRWTTYGFEYRSLPSFIVGPELTDVILTFALGAARKMVSCYNSGEPFTYNLPPRKSDYLVFFSEDMYHRFGRYVNGDKNKIFLTNALDNWGVGSAFKPIIKISNGGGDNSLYKGIEITKKLQKFLKKLWEDNEKELKKLSVIDVHIGTYDAIESPYVCRCGKMFVLARGCEKDKAIYPGGVSGTMKDARSAIRVTGHYSPEDCASDIFPIIDCISLAIASKIGRDSFDKIRRSIRSILETYSDPPSAEFVISEGPDSIDLEGHDIVDYSDEQITDYYESISEEDGLCEEFTVVRGCHCIRCVAIRDYRAEHCENCGNECCVHYPHSEDDEDYNEEDN